MVEMSPEQAREFWKALVENASSLITDAHTLLYAESYGRARSLTVLAQEELGKALWIYDAFQTPWSQGDASSRVVDALARHGRSHTKKYLEAIVFGDELAEFWGGYAPSAMLERAMWRGRKPTKSGRRKLSSRRVRPTSPSSRGST